uniref:Ubiquitin-conjugating enzyme E2 1-like n=1 Tax=Rhizophora mucronata TaxID=61149 RepID=A0A2P2M6V3_RHIMU
MNSDHAQILCITRLLAVIGENTRATEVHRTSHTFQAVMSLQQSLSRNYRQQPESRSH